MITESMIANLAAMAGADFTWSNVVSSRPHTDIRTGLKAFLYRYANGLCVFCGKHVDEGVSQACHIVSSGGPKVRRGYVAGNIANGCGDCNDTHGELGYDVIPYSEIRHPELVPTVWPRMPDLRADGVRIKATRNAQRSA